LASGRGLAGINHNPITPKEDCMTRAELFKKLDYLLDDAERNRTFGTVEFEIREGKVVLLRTIKTEKIEDRGNQPHVANKNRY
jgi:hypothetical protein